jgi:hypothetical protein
MQSSSQLLLIFNTKTALLLLMETYEDYNKNLFFLGIYAADITGLEETTKKCLGGTEIIIEKLNVVPSAMN